MADSYYDSVYTGQQIDDGIGRILSGDIDTSVDSASSSAAAAANSAISAAASAETAKQYSGKPPIIQNGTFWTWNAANGQYEDTGSPARGPKGEPGERGPQGIQGPEGPRGIDGVAVAADGQYAFNVNADGDLILTYTGQDAPDFYIAADGTLRLRVA